MFLNLLTNAGDAMPEGGTLTLRVQPATAGERGRRCVIEFADTGVGIPPEHLDKVIEPFFTTKEEGKGTGLGLAICRRIVQEHQRHAADRQRGGPGDDRPRRCCPSGPARTSPSFDAAPVDPARRADTREAAMAEPNRGPPARSSTTRSS